MNKRKINSTGSFVFNFMALVSFIVFMTSSAQLSGQEKVKTEPIFKVYADKGEVIDQKNGIFPTTKQIKIVAKEENGIQFRVSRSQAILVTGGHGRELIESNDTIDIGEIISKYDFKDGGILSIEIKEYYRLDTNRIVTSHKPMLRFFNIPITPITNDN